MSAHGNGSGDNRRSLLGEFSAANIREFEIWKDRDFKETRDAQIQMRSENLFEKNNAKQLRDAELDALKHNNNHLPSYDISGGSAKNNSDRYDSIMQRHTASLEQLDIKYSDIRDNIRENGVTLQDEFSDQSTLPMIEPEPATSDLEQLGIDTQYEFNSASSSDGDYYGASVGYDYNDSANPFTEDWESSHYEGDFRADDGNDNGNEGNDGGGRGM